MIKINSTYIPQPGYVFQAEGGYTLTSSKECPEVKIEYTLDSIIKILPGFYDISGMIAVKTNVSVPKDEFMKRLFKESDQIAIMLNYMEDPENEVYKKKYEVMQGWRKWFSEIQEYLR